MGWPAACYLTYLGSPTSMKTGPKTRVSARVKKRKRVSFGGNKLPHVRSFTILRSWEGSTSFDNNNCVDFSGEKKVEWSFSGDLFFQNSRKKLLSLNPPNCLFDLLTYNFSSGPLLSLLTLRFTRLAAKDTLFNNQKFLDRSLVFFSSFTTKQSSVYVNSECVHTVEPISVFSHVGR